MITTIYYKAVISFGKNSSEKFLFESSRKIETIDFLNNYLLYHKNAYIRIIEYQK